MRSPPRLVEIDGSGENWSKLIVKRRTFAGRWNRIDQAEQHCNQENTGAIEAKGTRAQSLKGCCGNPLAAEYVLSAKKYVQ